MHAKTDEAIIHQWAYKPDEMRAMLVAVLRLALRGGEFSANDLPTHGAEAHGGSGIAGSVILQLKRDGVFTPVGVWVGDTFMPKIVLNACGNKIGVYRIAKNTLAKTLLDRHAPTPRPAQQTEMALA